jgi:hypothetical protein
MNALRLIKLIGNLTLCSPGLLLLNNLLYVLLQSAAPFLFFSFLFISDYLIGHWFFLGGRGDSFVRKEADKLLFIM